jgi:hypothetical protein
MTTYFDDGYQLPQMPGHRVNHKAAEVERLWRESNAVLDMELTAGTEQEKELHRTKRLRLEAMATAIERGGLELVEGNAPLCTCGRGRVVWHGLCPDCLSEEDKAVSDTAASVRETR